MTDKSKGHYMPNWCENELTVSGYEKPKQFKQFIEKALKNPIKGKKSQTGEVEYPLLGNLYPVPKHIYTGSLGQKEREKYGKANWYDWCIENWGTKWDVNARLADGDVDDEYITFHFDSAWSPPVAWLHHIQKLFPDLDFKLKYDEPGMQFAGVATGTEDSSVKY